jgi:hypothetical protein
MKYRPEYSAFGCPGGCKGAYKAMHVCALFCLPSYLEFDDAVFRLQVARMFVNQPLGRCDDALVTALVTALDQNRAEGVHLNSWCVMS